MTGHMFYVGSRPFCVWDWDLKAKNLEFIKSIDYEYFQYLAVAHGENLGGQNDKRAALALRASYYHSLETLFSLICATLQAPGCVVGWIQKYRQDDVRSILADIESGRRSSLFRYTLKECDWNNISRLINSFSHENKNQIEETGALFSTLWTRLAGDYLSELNIREYNSIKHGFRVKSGGFTLMAGLERQEGVEAPAENMQTLGGSKYGTTFFVAQKIEGAPELKPDPVFWVKRHSINWDVQALVSALQLVSLSINNVVSFLKVQNGVDPKTVAFLRPKNSSFFEEPWSKSVGVLNCSFDSAVHEENIERLSSEDIGRKLSSILGRNANDTASDEKNNG